MTKSRRKQKFAALIVGILMLMSVVLGGVSFHQASAAGATTVVDVSKGYQTFDGWGLSLSWWANEMGDWTRQGVSGKQKREEIMEALYGESGLALNIARYNVGGGDDPAHTHMTHDRNMPGWRGATLVTEGDQSYYVPDEKYAFEGTGGENLAWQDTPDYRQLWVLDWIQKNRDDVITEYYSNSPPYWMTKSGCSSGSVGPNVPKESNNGGKSENLVNDVEHNEAFVRYILDVYEYLVSQGFEFQNIQPFNESGENYWYWSANGSQEGCHFSAEQQAEILNILAREIKRRGIDAKYNFGDETNTGRANDQYDKVRKVTLNDGTRGADLIDGAGRLTYHIYSHDIQGVQKMYRKARAHDQEVYMSEITFTEGDEYNPNAMGTGFKYTNGIIDTVKYGGVDAYVYWQGVEDMAGQIKTSKNYGLIQGVYYTDSNVSADTGYNVQDYVLSKAYYLNGQFTKYIRPGYRIVDADERHTLAAVSPDGKTLVVVKQNEGGASDFTVNLKGFRATSVEKVYTDPSHNWVHSYLSTDGTAVSDSISAQSVTTYIIQGTSMAGESYFLDDSMAQKCDSLDAIKAAMQAGGDTAQMYCTYDAEQCDGNDKRLFGSSYTNETEYMAFRFYGIGYGLVFPTKSDAGEIRVWCDQDPSATDGTEIDLHNDSEVLNKAIGETKSLEAGWHTVYVRSTKEQTGVDKKGNPTWKWFNFDGAYVYVTPDRDDEGDVLAITDVFGVGATVAFTYALHGYEGCTLYAETRVGNEWVRQTSPLADNKGTVAIAAGMTSATVRLVAVRDGELVFATDPRTVSVQPAAQGVLYFADCGAFGSDLATGAVLGRAQSTPDMAYGADPVTGLRWGYTNTFTGSKSYYATNEAMTSMLTAKNGGGDSLAYKFTLPQGEYTVTVGFFGGGSGWGQRAQTVTVTGCDAKEVTLKEQECTAAYFAVTATEETEISVTVGRGTGNDSQEVLLSAIVITDKGVKLPLYTAGASNYNSECARESEITLGSDVHEELKDKTVTVYFAGDAEADTVTENITYTVRAASVAAGRSMRASLHMQKYPDITAYLDYVWTQSGAKELYYNIDIGYTGAGTPPDDTAGLIGSKQTTTHDQTFGVDSVKGTSWGYVGNKFDEGVSWPDDKLNKWSIREEKEDGKNLTYKMTGFAANENLEIVTGGHCSNWGTRTFEVYCNGTKCGEITLTQNADPIEQKFDCTADAKGELTVEFKKKTGDNPQVAFIKVWTRGEDLTQAATITVDKTAAGLTDSITLGNLETGAAVYVLDDSGNMLGGFGATEATKTVAVNAYAVAGTGALRFVQVSSDTSVSEPAEVKLEMPELTYTLTSGYVREGDATVLQVVPKDIKNIKELSLHTPDGVTIDLLQSFFYRIKKNGTYKLKLVAGSLTSEQNIEVGNIDTVDFGATFSTTEWTAGAVTLTLAPTAVSGIASVQVNGQAVALTDGKYAIEATENGEYTVRVVTLGGNEYEKTFAVTNIDTAAANVQLGLQASSAAGVSIGYSSSGISGGTLKVKYNDGETVDVIDAEQVDITRAGKYTFTFVNGVGQSTAEKVYYVSYGAAAAQLASVQVGGDGTVTVSGADAQTLYRAGEATALGAMRADKAGKYYLELTKDGQTEIVVIDIASKADGRIVSGTGIEQGGSVGGMVAGIVIGSLCVAAAAGFCVWMMIKRRKAA